MTAVTDQIRTAMNVHNTFLDELRAEEEQPAEEPAPEPDPNQPELPTEEPAEEDGEEDANA